MGDTEQYHDTDGNPVTLEKLCRDEPMWAVSRIRHMRQQLAELEQQLTWIPVSERLPEDESDCLTMVVNGTDAEPIVQIDFFEDGAWRKIEDFEQWVETTAKPEGSTRDYPEVTHWLPIPKGR